MSIYEGKSVSVADELFGSGGYFDKNGNPVKMGDPNVHVYYSDEMLDFMAFKKETGGVLYQDHHIPKVTISNQDFVKKYCKLFDYTKHVNRIPDKRCKSGYKEKVTYTYKYWNKDMTLQEINKTGVYITTEIHFDTILDLIKYYPYRVSSSGSVNGKRAVFIDTESYVDKEYKDSIRHGYVGSMKAFYDKTLQRHYLEICKDYLCYKLEERTCLENIPTECVKEDNDYYYYELQHEVDPNHELLFKWEDGYNHIYHSNPKHVEGNLIKIHKQNIDQYLKPYIEENSVKIQYVQWPDGGFPIHL